ncbi:Lipid-A-disaccharide synthase (EC [Olavius sp. associated proteobacterium Delta 1]|nr:Lipid-A-disaccharide synthase (EC [Olavius sp. associated proteobacterium Delta 1]
MKSTSNKSCVAIVAGEASGDQHGAKLVRAMRKKNPELFFCGIGGPALRQAGVRIVLDSAELTVVGITEVLCKIPGILKGMGIIKKLLKSLKPDLLILIDFPDFNLHIASGAKKLGIPVLYYISPQIWAWRRGRGKRIGKLVDRMAVILPFEEQFYQEFDVPVTFVGHPLLDDALPPVGQTLKSGVQDPPVIGLVPGSREDEITRLLPIMLDAGDILKQRLKNVTFMVSQAVSIDSGLIQNIVNRHPVWEEVNVVSDGVEGVLEYCDAIVAASGTVTLQAAIHGTPLVIIYKVSPISAWLAKILVRVPNVGLVNLVAGRELAPELLQDDATGDNIARAIQNMLKDEDELNHLRRRLFALRDVLGGAGASDRVAELALEMIKK